MHSPSHTPARDHDAPWSAEAKPAKRAKKKAAKKKSTAKTSAKKKSTKKKSVKSSAKKSSGARGVPGSITPEELVARLRDPTTARAVLEHLRRALAATEPAAGAPTTATLRHEVAALEREVADLRHKLAELSALVADLRAADDDDEVLEDPFAWIRRDPSITRYQGQHVALHPTRGVVAHASRLDAMLAELRASDVSLDDIVLDYIADSPF